MCIWQWQQQGVCVPGGVRTPADGAWLQCPFCGPPKLLGLQVVPVHRPLVVAAHAHLWCLRIPLCFSPAACRSRKRCCIEFSSQLPLAHTRGAWLPEAHRRDALSPIAHTSGTSPPIACARGALPSESLLVCRERYSYGNPPLLLLPFPTMAPCFSCEPRPPPRFPQLWCSVPQSMLFRFVAHGAPVPSPSGCLHTANPSSLPGTALWSPSLITQPPPECLRLCCLRVVVQMVCAARTLLCPPQSSCCTFL